MQVGSGIAFVRHALYLYIPRWQSPRGFGARAFRAPWSAVGATPARFQRGLDILSERSIVAEETAGALISLNKSFAKLEHKNKEGCGKRPSVLFLSFSDACRVSLMLTFLSDSLQIPLLSLLSCIDIMFAIFLSHLFSLWDLSISIKD